MTASRRTPGAYGVVLWDFDGTIAHRPGMWRQCLIEALDEILPGHAVTADAVRPGLQDGFPWHAPAIAHHHLSDPDVWWAALHPLFERAYLGAGVAAPDARAAALRVRDHYLRPARWVVYDDSVAALELLRTAGFKNVVVSNHVPELATLIADLALDLCFDGVVTSARVGFEKPHPAIFQAALAVVPDRTSAWMVGDNQVADIDAAKALGIPGLMVRKPIGSELPLTALDAAHRILTPLA